MPLPRPSSLLCHNHGQASVFVLALLGVVLVCAIFLYQSGRITSEKMELQNAADAAAFSAATLEARSLNFAAYTNRAMVGNEVAVGQLIGLLSWADQMTQSEEYADIYTTSIEVAGDLLAAILVETIGGAAIVEAATQILVTTIDTIAGVMTLVGEAMEVFLDAVASPAIGGLSLINEVYSVSQEIYHGATYALVVKNIYQSLQDNVPGTTFSRSDIFKKHLSGAQLSDLGVIALVGHLPSFWSGYTRMYSSSTSEKKKKEEEEKKKKKEEEKKKKEEEKKKEGEGGGSSGKDDKKGDDGKGKKDKKEEKKDKKQAEKDADNRKGMGRLAATVREARDPFTSGGRPRELTRDWQLELDLKMYKRILGIKLGAGITFGFEGKGASELRQKNDTFLWSAADTGVAAVKLRALGHGFGIGAPFNAGAFQGPEKVADPLLPQDILPSFPASLTYGDRHVEAYGGAGEQAHLTAWPGVIKEMGENSVETYKGLRPYRDMTELDSKPPGKIEIPFQAPFFLVGVTKPLKDITEKGPRFSGRLKLTEYDHETNVDRLGAIAKSELYFARPTNLNYFVRSDKKRERPNVFSPFWQARLVDTSNQDRFLALAMQQKVLWLSEKEKKFVGGHYLDDAVHFIDEILEAASGVVDRLLRLLL